MENEKSTEVRQSELIEKLANTNVKLHALTQNENVADNLQTIDEEWGKLIDELNGSFVYSVSDIMEEETNGKETGMGYIDSLKSCYGHTVVQSMASQMLADTEELNDDDKKWNFAKELMTGNEETRKAITSEKNAELSNAKEYYAEILKIEADKNGLSIENIEAIDKKIKTAEEKCGLKKPDNAPYDSETQRHEIIRDASDKFYDEYETTRECDRALMAAFSTTNEGMMKLARLNADKTYDEYNKLKNEYMSEVEKSFEIEKDRTIETKTPQAIDSTVPAAKTKTESKANPEAAAELTEKPDTKTVTIEDVMETRSSRKKGLEDPESKATVRIGVPATEKSPTGYVFLKIDRKDFQPEKQNGVNNGKGSITLPANTDIYARTQTEKDSENYKTLKFKTDELGKLHKEYTAETVTIESVRETKSSKEVGENNKKLDVGVRIGVPKTEEIPEGCVYLNTKRENYHPDENRAEKRIGDIEIPAHRTISVGVRNPDNKGYSLKILRGEELKKMHDEYMSQMENEKWVKSADISKQKNEQLTFDDVCADIT